MKDVNFETFKIAGQQKQLNLLSSRQGLEIVICLSSQICIIKTEAAIFPMQTMNPQQFPLFLKLE